jgi:hypothetical protein
LSGSHVERFDPREQDGNLIATEHRARYRWAARLVAGRRVLDAACGTGYGMRMLADAGAAGVRGIDRDAGAVAEAARRMGDPDAVVRGDVRDLPFPDNAFDVVVSWETIEHLDAAERALAEFRRVLRERGLLLVSSPNPRVYPPGNEHHVHEWEPAELVGAVARHFTHVGRFRQHPWLASTIEPVGDGGGGVERVGAAHDVARLAPLEPDGETYGLVAASTHPLPALGSLTALGSPFDLQWWSEQLMRARAAESDTAERLGAASAQLLRANQALAELPALRYERDEARRQAARIGERLVAIEGSRSWRWLAPLRRLRAAFRRSDGPGRGNR